MNYFCILNLFLVCVVLYGNIVLSVVAENVLNRSKCMKDYYENESTYKVCEDHPCLLFKVDEPYVYLHSNNFTRHPFKCKESLEKYRSDLGGSFFQFIKSENIPPLEDAYCIFNGDECSFNDEIDFLSDSYRKNPSHQFIVAGIMFIMSYRINNDSIPSTPFTHGPILIVGPIESRHLTFTEALHVVSGPFEPMAWHFILVILLFFAIVRIGISLSFTHPLSWLALWWNIWGEYATAERHINVDAETSMHTLDLSRDSLYEFAEAKRLTGFRRSKYEESREMLCFYNKYWSISAKLFLFLTVLFYELALFNHVFEIMARPPKRNIANLTENDMKKFVLLRDSGIEKYFKLTADPRGEYNSSVSVPWVRVSSLDAAYRYVLDSKNKTFSVSYDWSLILEMNRNQTCDKLTFYETDVKRSYNGGWFYSKGVRDKNRVAIDKSLSELVELGKADDLLHEHDASEYKYCGRNEPRVNFMLLFLPLLPMSLFLMIGIFVRVLFHLGFVASRRRVRTN